MTTTAAYWAWVRATYCMRCREGWPTRYIYLRHALALGVLSPRGLEVPGGAALECGSAEVGDEPVAFGIGGPTGLQGGGYRTEVLDEQAGGVGQGTALLRRPRPTRRKGGQLAGQFGEGVETGERIDHLAKLVGGAVRSSGRVNNRVTGLVGVLGWDIRAGCRYAHR